MNKIYFDTNQLYYIRRIADEAQGDDYGNYEWACTLFPNSPELIQDIRALCYIVAMQYEWELDFLPSDASYAELCLSEGKRAQITRKTWQLFAKGLDDERQLRRVPFLPSWPVSGHLSLEFVDDPDDRVILRYFAAEKADVLLTSDAHILEHKDRLAALNLHIMRPRDWLNAFLKNVRGDEEAVDWVERTLFGSERV